MENNDITKMFISHTTLNTDIKETPVNTRKSDNNESEFNFLK